MKKVVIIEDKPWVTKEEIKHLQDRKNVEVFRIVYFPNQFGNEEEKKKLLSELKAETGVRLDEVKDQETFVMKMEELYSMENTVFFMDYELKGDNTVEADLRINIRYAKYKEYGKDMDPDARKIWFYTTSGIGNVEIITRNFPDRVLPVESFRDQILTWNQDKINQILE